MIWIFDVKFLSKNNNKKNTHTPIYTIKCTCALHFSISFKPLAMWKKNVKQYTGFQKKLVYFMIDGDKCSEAKKNCFNFF